MTHHTPHWSNHDLVFLTTTWSQSAISVERLELVGLHWCLVLVQMRERILRPVVVCIIVGIDGLCFQTCDGIKFLNGGGAQTCQRSEHCSFDLGHLRVLHCIHKGVLSLCRMVLQLLCCIFLTKGRDLVEVHLEIVGHLLGQFILRSLLR